MFPEGSQNQYGNNDRTISRATKPRWKKLITLIRDVSSPDTWRENGGSNGSISPFQNTIIVRNTILVHQRLAVT